MQERIAEDPVILGLGKLVLRDKERIQPRSGRLDLLLQDPDDYRRYEVELQLGGTNEAHIIRTIEYWDVEKKRYPQYDHCAVLVAEDITSRFFNVIGLFNDSIPLIAIQMTALRHEDKVALIFTKILDRVKRGLVDEDEEVQEDTDRSYWESKGKESVAIADRIHEMVKQLAPDLSLKYNKFYIGLAKDGIPNNVVIFRPKKAYLRFEPRLDESPEIEKLIENSGLEVMDYDKRWGRYRIRITAQDLSKHRDLLMELIKRAFSNSAP